METKKRNKVKFDPFSSKQLAASVWWMDPRLFKAQNFRNEVQTHPQWLNRADKEAIICDGSVRAGKTFVMSVSYIRWSMTNFDGQQFGIAGKTIGSLRRNLIRPLVNVLESQHYQVKDSRSENMLTITHHGISNRYFLFGGKDESSQDLVQGLTAAGFFFDEVALMPQSFVNQATARVSVDGGKYWFNCNPSSPYHWFKLEWLDKLSEHKAIHIHFTMRDNPSLSEATIDRYERMYTGVFYQRYILGQWVLSDGVVYDNFNRQTMVTKPPHPAHITNYVVSCDYGALNPTVFLLWGFSNGIWYCLKEYYFNGRKNKNGHQKSDDQYADDMTRFVGRIKAPIILDPSAVHFAIKLQQRGYRVIPANNDVLDGIRLTQSLMSNGKIMFTPGLPNLFKELASYVWDDKAAQHGEDRVVKQHDHAMDAMRYFCMGVLAPKSGSSGMKTLPSY